jgi:cell division protein FtsQ
LGLAEQPVRLAGHPRIRERAVANLTRRRRRDRAVTASIAALLAIVLLGIGVVRSPLLAVERVALLGLDQSQRAALAEVVPVAPGTNVMDVDLEAVRRQVEAVPWVLRASATRRPPSTVEVRVTTRSPVAVAVAQDGRWLLDAEGVAIEPVEGDDAVAARGSVADLPEIPVLAAPTVGQPVADRAVRAAAAVAAAMPPAMDEWIVGYRTSAAGEVEAILRVPTGAGAVELVAWLGRPERIRAKAATLAALVDETVGRGRTPAVLDVRIPDRPVVRS